jgi:hypothetical protein
MANSEGSQKPEVRSQKETKTTDFPGTRPVPNIRLLFITRNSQKRFLLTFFQHSAQHFGAVLSGILPSKVAKKREV